MDSTLPTSPSLLERLPPEMLKAILGELDSISSLHAAALSCRAVWDAYRSTSSTIATSVLKNCLASRGVEPEAVAALRANFYAPPSSLSTSVTPDLLRGFCASYIHGRGASNRHRLPVALAHRDLILLQRLHNTVASLAKTFARQCLASAAEFARDDGPRVVVDDWRRIYSPRRRAPGVEDDVVASDEDLPDDSPSTYNPNSSPLPPTAAEMARIERALYRFQLMRHLLLPIRQTDRKVWEQYVRVLMGCFAPWEREQIVCVYEFLVRLISPAFHDVADHDIVWGHERIPRPDASLGEQVEVLMLQGLGFLRDLGRAKTYEARHSLLNPKSKLLRLGTQVSGPYKALIWAREWSLVPGSDVPLRTVENAAALNHFCANGPFYREPDDGPFPLYRDPDEGPFRTWQRAHRVHLHRSGVYMAGRWRLRQWGYVFWDLDRAEVAAFLRRKSWHPDEASDGEDGPSGRWNNRDRNGSWEARSKIYEKGGRGWWDFGDESRIEWLEMPPPKPRWGYADAEAWSRGVDEKIAKMRRAAAAAGPSQPSVPSLSDGEGSKQT